MDTSRTIAILVFCVAAVVGGFRYLLLPLQGLRRAREVGNCADMQVYQQLVTAYLGKHGRYPASLIDAVDARKSPELARLVDRYGTSIRYESNGNGQQFILVSYGSDGKPEATDYWPYRTRSVLNRTLEDERLQCAAGGDVVFTDQGCYRCCGH